MTFVLFEGMASYSILVIDRHGLMQHTFLGSFRDWITKIEVLEASFWKFDPANYVPASIEHQVSQLFLYTLAKMEPIPDQRSSLEGHRLLRNGF